MDVVKKIVILASTLLSLVVLCNANGKEHVKCERTYNKIGCFHAGTIVNHLLVNDRDATSDKHQGYNINWADIESYLHSLACRCAEEAKKLSYNYFGIRYYGECYGGNVKTVNKDFISSDCFEIGFKICNDTNIAECGGKHSTDYIYKLISDQEKDVDGGYSSWSTWSHCSAECGGGHMSRSRSCSNPIPMGKGKNCSVLGNDTEIAECGMKPCPVDGGFSEWTIFGECSKTCGGGVSKRTRACTNPVPAHGGQACSGVTEETKVCNTEACPIDGGYSGWRPVGNCTKECGGGEQLYRRNCDNPAPAHGGANCSRFGPASDTRPCNTQLCPVDGGLSNWSSYGPCNRSCGSGFKYRTRLCNNPAPANGGKDCTGALREATSCFIEHCKGNLAQGRPTKQSSTGWSGLSSRAVDGRRDSNYHKGSCTHTQRAQNPWWRVDLGGNHVIGYLKITNRGDCCSNRLRNVEIRVGSIDKPKANKVCTYYPHALSAGETTVLSCDVPLVGRYVYVSLRAKEWLTLCEVEVYSPDASLVSPEYLERVCEHSTARIICPAGTHIRITDALYGRKTKAHCRRGWALFWSTNCKARRSYPIARNRCNNRRHCSVPAKNWLFGDPCPHTYKYLDIKYRCFGSTPDIRM